jgi:hypothetical protein
VCTTAADLRDGGNFNRGYANLTTDADGGRFVPNSAQDTKKHA